MGFYPGQSVGSYRIVELLGQGAMATVYKAQHSLLDRFGALKVMHQFLVNDPHFIESFEREAQIIAKLDHPNIVPVYDYAQHEGNRYLVMKFIEGISLQTVLEDGPLELADIRRVMAAIASALDYAHVQGVLHRDIKPSNIMIDRRGTPYLADFGLAQAIENEEGDATTGRIVGTPAYIAPEQATKDAVIDNRADLYSLGVLLYQLIVGRVPFKGTSVAEILHKHKTEPPPRPSALNPEVPPQLEKMLLRALAKDPDKRFDSGAEMVEAFEGALEAAGIDALNAFERHSIKFSLAKPRPKQTAIPRGSTLKPEKPAASEKASSPGSGSAAASNVRPLSSARKPSSGSRKAAPARKSGGVSVDLLLLIGFFVVVAVLLIVVFAIVIGQQNAAMQAIPTLVPGG
jgi:serine/threonine-protein kinase